MLQKEFTVNSKEFQKIRDKEVWCKSTVLHKMWVDLIKRVKVEIEDDGKTVRVVGILPDA